MLYAYYLYYFCRVIVMVGKNSNPGQGREQVSISDADRQEAIAKKKAELDSLNIDDRETRI